MNSEGPSKYYVITLVNKNVNLYCRWPKPKVLREAITWTLGPSPCLRKSILEAYKEFNGYDIDMNMNTNKRKSVIRNDKF